MIFGETGLPGALLIMESERREDQRGFFGRTWCARECGARVPTAENRKAPCATLEDHGHVLYPMSEVHLPERAQASDGTIHHSAFDGRTQIASSAIAIAATPISWVDVGRDP